MVWPEAAALSAIRHCQLLSATPAPRMPLMNRGRRLPGSFLSPRLAFSQPAAAFSRQTQLKRQRIFHITPLAPPALSG